MFNIQLSVNVKDKQLLTELQKEIKTELIQKGLDKPILSTLEQLKSSLRSFINKQTEKTKPGQTPSDDNTPGGNMPKTDQEMLKFLTGVDLDKIRKSKDYTSAIESKVVVVDQRRARIRFPISDSETFEQNYKKAMDFFSQSIYAMVDSSGRVSYYVNTGVNMAQYVKVVCSTDTGDSKKSRKKFDYYKNSNKMTRQGGSEIGRFAEWTLKQEGITNITNGLTGFINITNVIDSLKEGDTQTASDLLKSFAGSPKAQGLQAKVDDLKTKTNLTPGMATQNNIMSLINNLKIEKVVKESQTTYNLISMYSESKDQTNVSFFDEVNSNINVWIIGNSDYWIREFTALAESLLKKYS